VTPQKSPGYVNIGPLEIYYERHGTGRPLVLLHGAFGTIESCFAELLPRLARHFEVVAVELQGHGHTSFMRVARPSIRAGCIRSSWRDSSHSIRASSTERGGTRRTAGSRPIPMRGDRSS